MFKSEPRVCRAQGIRKHELSGEVRKDTYAIRTLVDQTVEHAPHNG